MIRWTNIYDVWLSDFFRWLCKYMIAVWSLTLVSLVIICSKECVKQNSKYVLIRWGISLLIEFADLFLKISLSSDLKFILMSSRRYHSCVSMSSVSLNVRYKQFTKSWNKIPIRTGLDLSKKSLYKNTLCINAKIKFLIIWNRVLNKTSYASSSSGSAKYYQVTSFYSETSL